MTTEPDKADFFLSYTGADSAWAEWVTKALEDAGYRVIVQLLDFRPGDNFVLAMDSALAGSHRLMMLLSPTYMASGFTAAEWSAVFRLDPTGAQRLLIPVLVEDFRVPGLLGPRVYIKLHGLSEPDARDALLRGLVDPRTVRAARPKFPSSS
ncbi:toll/interleukin-1 receptor domain-containing protein [Streptomyces cinnamoneus]